MGPKAESVEAAGGRNIENVDDALPFPLPNEDRRNRHGLAKIWHGPLPSFNRIAMAVRRAPVIFAPATDRN